MGQFWGVVMPIYGTPEGSENPIQIGIAIFPWLEGGGWAPGGGGGGLSWSQAVRDCVKELFNVQMTSFSQSQPGQNGSFQGTGPNGQNLSITNDVQTFTVADLNMIRYGQSTPTAGNTDIQGLTMSGPRVTNYWWTYIPDPMSVRIFSPSTNYSASNLAPAAMWGTQVHELGHSIADLLGLAKPNTEDPFGSKMQDCVNKRLATQVK
jgi:hypothetical protein